MMKSLIFYAEKRFFHVLDLYCSTNKVIATLPRELSLAFL